MPDSDRTFTVIGLSLRDETMVRSLVDAAGYRASLRWRIVEDLDADVALCAPDSPLSRIALERGKKAGRPRCIAYGAPADHGGDYAAVLRLPMRPSELLDAIDALEHGDRRVEAPVAGVPRPDLVGLSFVRAMASLRAEDRRGPERWLIRLDRLQLDVLVPERTCELLTEDVALETLVDRLVLAPVTSLEILPRNAGDGERLGRKPLDALLWRIGLRDEGGEAAAWAAARTPLRLRRWPDFGRLRAHRSHLAMASHLTRSALTPAELGAAAGCDGAQVLGFLNACACLQLIQEEAGEAPVAVRQTGGFTKLMRSLRAAIGIGS